MRGRTGKRAKWHGICSQPLAWNGKSGRSRFFSKAILRPPPASACRQIQPRPRSSLLCRPRPRISLPLLARLPSQPQELCPALPCESIFLVTPPPSSLGPLLTLSSSPLQLSSFPRLHTLCPCLLSSSSFISARLALDLVARRDIGAAPERAASLQAFHPPSIKAVATVTCISLPRVHLYHPPPPPIPPHPLVGSDVQRQR